MELELSGHTAVIVGGAKGIGRAIAEAFASEHAKVVLFDLDHQVATTAEQLTSTTGNPVAAHVLDATDYAMLRRRATVIGEETPGDLHLVYAAGRGSGKYGFPFWNLDPADWQQVVDTNLLGAVNTTHAFVPGWVNRPRKGSLLFLSSVAAQIGSQTDPPYSAAKAGLINFAQCAAKDLAPYDVRVNVICPGMVQTELNRSVWQAWHDGQPPDRRLSYEAWTDQKIRGAVPLGRWQTCEDIAALAIFLASPRANNITGQTLNVDGGQVMH